MKVEATVEQIVLAMRKASCYLPKEALHSKTAPDARKASHGSKQNLPSSQSTRRSQFRALDQR